MYFAHFKQNNHLFVIHEQCRRQVTKQLDELVHLFTGLTIPVVPGKHYLFIFRQMAWV